MAVRRLNGVGEVAGDWRSHTVTIEYDPESIDVEAIQQAMMVRIRLHGARRFVRRPGTYL